MPIKESKLYPPCVYKLHIFIYVYATIIMLYTLQKYTKRKITKMKINTNRCSILVPLWWWRPLV